MGVVNVMKFVRHHQPRKHFRFKPYRIRRRGKLRHATRNLTNEPVIDGDHRPLTGPEAALSKPGNSTLNRPHRLIDHPGTIPGNQLLEGHPVCRPSLGAELRDRAINKPGWPDQLREYLLIGASIEIERIVDRSNGSRQAESHRSVPDPLFTSETVVVNRPVDPERGDRILLDQTAVEIDL